MAIDSCAPVWRIVICLPYDNAYKRLPDLSVFFILAQGEELKPPSLGGGFEEG